MAEQIITIDISATGDVQIEGHDIVGPECKTLTEDIENALGTVTETRKKPEFLRTPPIKRKVGA